MDLLAIGVMQAARSYTGLSLCDAPYPQPAALADIVAPLVKVPETRFIRL
jgi:hypothetical protein